MVSREKCLEWAEDAIFELANRAYREGQKDMQDRIIDKLGSYDANKCAQIAASLEIK